MKYPGETFYELWDLLQLPPTDSSDKRTPQQRETWGGVVEVSKSLEEIQAAKKSWEALAGMRNFPTTYTIFKVTRETVKDVKPA